MCELGTVQDAYGATEVRLIGLIRLIGVIAVIRVIRVIVRQVTEVEVVMRHWVVSTG